MKLASAVLFAAFAGAQANQPNQGKQGKKPWHINQGPTIPIPTVYPVPHVKNLPVFPVELDCTPPTSTCPPGFTQDGNACVREVTSAASFICHAGALRDGMCHSKIPSFPTCEDGQTLRGDICIAPISTPPIPRCPAGYSETGNACTKTVPAPVVDVCKVGSRVGDRCVVTRRTEPRVDVYCPDGFDEEGNECCKIETYDCTPQGTTLLDCNSDDDEFCISKFRHLKGGKTGKYEVIANGVRSVVPVLEVPLPPLERVVDTAVISQICQKKIVTALIRDVFCVEGELRGGACIAQDFHPTVRMCTAGDDPDYCFATSTVPYHHVCPEGYSMSGGSCAGTVESAPIPTCPPEFQLADSICTKALPATPVCREGVLKHGACYDNEYAPLTTSWCVICTGSSCHQRGCN